MKAKGQEGEGHTLEELWGYLVTEPLNAEEPPLWPPDIFGICAAALKKTGTYTKIALRSQRTTEERCLRDKTRKANADVWRAYLDNKADKDLKTQALAAVQALWGKLFEQSTYTSDTRLKLPLSRLSNDSIACEALTDLLILADTVCHDTGLPEEHPNAPFSAFRAETEQILFPTQFGSTLCKLIHPANARVLPKMHVAQSGLTVRSLSHNLAFIESEEVKASWISVPGSRGSDGRDTSRINILIAPWPETIIPTQFSAEVREEPYAGVNVFNVEVKSTSGELAEQLAALTTEAAKIVGSVDAVVLPELAMTTKDHRIVQRALLRQGVLVVAGVGSRDRSENYLTIDVPVSSHHALHFRQRKHHQWKLDGRQIAQYHLGSRLHTDKEYWENIDVQDRQLRFVVLRPWLVATSLLCEDLARHDPVGELIKGVGPNLVIALLMDGPQISKRWPGRYATGLADDPGCSVLSITSLGMAELSKSRNSDGKSSRIIGLWKDAFSGDLIELDLPRGANGVVITLAVRRREEFTADGRSDYRAACYPNLVGTHAVTLPKELPKLEGMREPVQWLSPVEAFNLAQIAQYPDSLSPDDPAHLRAEFMPKELMRLRGPAFRIGREIWRAKTNGRIPGSPNDAVFDEGELKRCGGWSVNDINVPIPSPDLRRRNPAPHSGSKKIATLYFNLRESNRNHRRILHAEGQTLSPVDLPYCVGRRCSSASAGRNDAASCRLVLCTRTAWQLPSGCDHEMGDRNVWRETNLRGSRSHSQQRHLRICSACRRDSCYGHTGTTAIGWQLQRLRPTAEEGRFQSASRTTDESGRSGESLVRCLGNS
jgi:hypothetical protein